MYICLPLLAVTLGRLPVGVKITGQVFPALVVVVVDNQTRLVTPLCQLQTVRALEHERLYNNMEYDLSYIAWCTQTIKICSDIFTVETYTL